MRPAAPLLLATVLLMAPLGAAAAPADDLSQHDRRQIADLAQRYLERRADKVTNVPQSSGFGIPTTDRMAAELRNDEIKLERRRQRWIARGGAGYSHAQVATELKRVTVANDGSVIAHVSERTELYFADSHTFQHTTFGFGHVLIFDRTAAGWALATATLPPRTKCGVPPETQFCGYSRER